MNKTKAFEAMTETLGLKELGKNFIHTIDKLDGKDITKIVLSLVAAGTICFVTRNSGTLEITYGEVGITLGKVGNPA